MMLSQIEKLHIPILVGVGEWALTTMVEDGAGYARSTTNDLGRPLLGEKGGQCDINGISWD